MFQKQTNTTNHNIKIKNKKQKIMKKGTRENNVK